MPSEFEHVEILILEDLSLSQRSMLIAKLDHERGIIQAWFDPENHHHLIVEYGRDHFSHLTLLDFIKLHGFHGKIVKI